MIWVRYKWRMARVNWYSSSIICFAKRRLVSGGIMQSFSEIRIHVGSCFLPGGPDISARIDWLIGFCTTAMMSASVGSTSWANPSWNEAWFMYANPPLSKIKKSLRNFLTSTKSDEWLPPHQEQQQQHKQGLSHWDYYRQHSWSQTHHMNVLRELLVPQPYGYMVQQLLTLHTIMNLLILLIYCQKALESALFHLLILVNQNQEWSFLAHTRKYRGVDINSTRLTWTLTKDIATAIK